jgi:PEP-CTERM motif
MRANCALIPLCLGLATQASAATLDFGSAGNPVICTAAADGSGPLIACGNGSAISQSYGDVAGSVDVSYSAPRVTNPQSLLWWAGSYNNLYGVAWAPGNDSNSRARIEIKAVNPGDSINLASFTLGAYPNTTLNTTVNIFAIGGTIPLFAFSGNVGNSGTNTPTIFSPNLTVNGGLWIEWADSAYNVGIDNIQYNVVPAVGGAVPEPSTWAMLLTGFGFIGAAARRRRSTKSLITG